MDVVIAGAHGKVARELIPQLVARGERVRGIIRDPGHCADVEADGAVAVVCDLESADDAEVDATLAGTDAIVFLAGAGPGSGAERKWTVDYGAAKKLIDGARRGGISRYVMLSSMGADRPPSDDAVFSVYLQAKAKADTSSRAAGLDHTIVRPTRLTDEPGQGTVLIGLHVDNGEVTRADVASVIAEVLADERTYHRTFEMVRGDTPIAAAGQVLSRLPADDSPATAR